MMMHQSQAFVLHCSLAHSRLQGFEISPLAAAGSWLDERQTRGSSLAERTEKTVRDISIPLFILFPRYALTPTNQRHTDW